MPKSFFILILSVTAAILPVVAAETGSIQTELTKVVAKPLGKTMVIPGELTPYQSVDVHARVPGFVETVHVDRGSFVKKGQSLAELGAPELVAQRVEAQSKIPVVVAQRIEAEAKLAAVESSFQHLAEAAKTPGAVAGNDIVLAEKAVEAARARIDSFNKTIAAYESSVRVIEETEKYLQIIAPFAGVITERYAHNGALVGPNARLPLFTLEQIERLRLVAAVPEAYKQSISLGRRVQFTVPAFPSETFTGVVARPAYAVDSLTRTMPVELDVMNTGIKLTSGMYAEVQWTVQRGGDTLFVPATAIQTTTEHIFVIRVNNGTAEWVNVRRGMTEGNVVEVFGDLHPGDSIVLRATDEIRPGTHVTPKE